MTDYMQKAREMSCDEDGELSVFQALGNLARTLESLDTERTRAEKAEQRERELRGGLEKFCKAYRVCSGPGALHDAYLEAEQILSRSLIQPEPDPLVEKVADIIASLVSGPTVCSRDGEFKEAHRKDQIAAAKEIVAALSIVKGESL